MPPSQPGVRPADRPSSVLHPSRVRGLRSIRATCPTSSTIPVNIALESEVFPKPPDAKLAQEIYAALEKEIASTERTAHFEKFCKKVELPDLQKNDIRLERSSQC